VQDVTTVVFVIGSAIFIAGLVGIVYGSVRKEDK
jgi:hypothetical protein